MGIDKDIDIKALTDIKSLTRDRLRELLISYGEKKFRADQVFSWLHEKNIESFSEMTNISQSMRKMLEETSYIENVHMETVLASKIDPTKKYLWELRDKNMVESVWMEYKHGNSVCISSQVGCACGCKFCASTIDGVVRNLTASEMLEQIYKMQTTEGKRISNIVIMGTGEPFLNFDNLVSFMDIINDEKGYNISHRNITVSTCGIIPKIYELAEMNLQITLAISLHAPNSEIRKSIMPIEEKYPIDDLLEACDYYFEKTGRRISYEYALMEGVNNSDDNAHELARLLNGRCCHVNLIKYNPVKERSYKNVVDNKAEHFKNILEKNKINVTIRRGLGLDIDGACGQLRRRYLR